MADPTRPDYSGVQSGLDMTKLPLYGQDDDRMQELKNAQQDALDALQKRYDQPNWWNVAAGFAKPQLGGFLASAGSAAEAMGQNLEAQRAQQLPIAQMKLQLAQSNMLLGANKKVADQVKAWRDSHPGQTPSSQQVGEWESMAPGSQVVASLKNELEVGQHQQNIDVQRQQSENQATELRIRQAEARQKANLPLSADDIDALTNKPANIPKKDFVPTVNNPNQPIPNTTYITDGKVHVDVDTYKPIVKDGKQRDAIDINRPITSEQSQLLQKQGWNQTDSDNPGHWERIGEAASTETKPAGAIVQPVQYKPTLPLPNTAGMGDEDRNRILDAYSKNAASIEAPNAKTIQDLQSIVTGVNYTTTKSNYDSVIDMTEKNPELAQQVFALLRKGGLEAALNQGIGFHAGSLTANVSLPIEAFKDANRPEAVKAFADTLFSKLGSLAMANVKAGGGSLSQTPQQEYMNALRQFANSNMTSFAAKHALNLSRAEFAHKKELYDQVMSELPLADTVHSQTPITDIMNQSSALQKIHAKYLGIQKYYNDAYNNRINAATNKEQQP